MDERKVVETVDKLLETIRYEIDEIREKGEDTSDLERQLEDFKKRSNSLIDWFIRDDEHAIKLFLTELVNFSRTVHDHYLSVQSGGLEEMEEISEAGAEELFNEEKETMSQLSETMDLISDEDALLKEELGEVEPEEVGKGKDLYSLLSEGSENIEENQPEENQLQGEPTVKSGVMKTEIPEIDDKVKDLQDLISTEKEKVAMLRQKGIDTLDKEFKISEQEQLLVSLREALIDGRYDDAKQLREKIEEIGRELF